MKPVVLARSFLGEPRPCASGTRFRAFGKTGSPAQAPRPRRARAPQTAPQVTYGTLWEKNGGMEGSSPRRPFSGVLSAGHLGSKTSYF